MGTTYSEFSWARPAAASAGSLNEGQAFPSVITGTVPDAGSSLALFGVALGGLGWLGRRFVR